jgi:hypothetical protein
MSRVRDPRQRLADEVSASGKNLTYVYITHGHGDHYFGLGRSRGGFRTSGAVAMAAVLDRIADQLEPDMLEGFWRQRFPGKQKEVRVSTGPHVDGSTKGDFEACLETKHSSSVFSEIDRYDVVEERPVDCSGDREIKIPSARECLGIPAVDRHLASGHACPRAACVGAGG